MKYFGISKKVKKVTEGTPRDFDRSRLFSKEIVKGEEHKWYITHIADVKYLTLVGYVALNLKHISNIESIDTNHLFGIKTIKLKMNEAGVGKIYNKFKLTLEEIR